MKNSEANPTATILREIADVLDAGGSPVEEFEHKPVGTGMWVCPINMGHLLHTVSAGGWQVRRKPKTVRVSGEVSREVTESARLIVQTNLGGNAEAVAHTLLSLVEDDHD